MILVTGSTQDCRQICNGEGGQDARRASGDQSAAYSLYPCSRAPSRALPTATACRLGQLTQINSEHTDDCLQSDLSPVEGSIESAQAEDELALSGVHCWHGVEVANEPSEGDLFVIVMPWAEATLNDEMRKKQIAGSDVAEVMHIMQCVAESVQHMHEQK